MHWQDWYYEQCFAKKYVQENHENIYMDEHPHIHADMETLLRIQHKMFELNLNLYPLHCHNFAMTVRPVESVPRARD